MQGAFHNQNQRLNPYNLNGYPLRDHIPQYSIPLQIPTLSNKPSQSFPFEGNSIWISSNNIIIELTNSFLGSASEQDGVYDVNKFFRQDDKPLSKLENTSFLNHVGAPNQVLIRENNFSLSSFAPPVNSSTNF